MAVEIDRSAQLLGERFFDTEDDQWEKSIVKLP
jgi:hypothetical protein